MDAPYWFPVLTLVIGAAAGYWVDLLREARAAAREQRQARTAFQRDTLIELQDWVAKLARATGAMHHQDEMEFRRSGKWGRHQLGEEVDLAYHAGIVNVRRYLVRVLDDEIRAAAHRFLEASIEATTGAMRDEDDRAARARCVDAMLRMGELATSLNERIGERLRALV